MRFAAHADHDIVGHRELSRLQPLLQPRLRVLRHGQGVDVRELGREHGFDDTVGGVETGVEKHGADDRFERVGENRRAGRAAAAQLALAEADGIAQLERGAEARQRIAVDEVRAHARQLALGDPWKSPVQNRRDRAVEHGVADELEPLVMDRAEAAVRECLAQQFRTAERVIQAIPKRVVRHPPAGTFADAVSA